MRVSTSPDVHGSCWTQKAAKKLHEDNQGAVRLAYSSGYHPRTSRMSLKYYYIGHLIKAKTVKENCIQPNN